MGLTRYILFIVYFLPCILLANAELPDPTRPATYIIKDLEPVYFDEAKVKNKINWILSAIRISDNDRTAILNGKLVRAGDDIGAAKVLEINPLSVVINHEERKLIVRLYESKVIKNYKSQK